MSLQEPAFPRRTFSWLAALVAAGCAAHRGPPSAAAAAGATSAATPSGDASLFAADDALSAALATRKPAEAFGAVLAPDVVFALPGADQARTRDAALALLTPLPMSATLTTLHRMGGATSADARSGYTFGWFLRTAAGGEATTYGKYLAAWRAEADGWRVEALQLRAAKRAPAPGPNGGAAAVYRGSPAPGDPAALTRAVLAADAEFAALSAAKGYSLAFEGFADPRAVCFTNGDFQWGMAGVRDVFGRWAPEEELTWSPSAGRAAASGDLAWTTGQSTMSVGTGAAASRSYSNYLTIWARQPDGSWRWLLDAGDSRPPPR
jgi:ketosteroid isomerase-like protein